MLTKYAECWSLELVPTIWPKQSSRGGAQGRGGSTWRRRVQGTRHMTRIRWKEDRRTRKSTAHERNMAMHHDKRQRMVQGGRRCTIKPR